MTSLAAANSAILAAYLCYGAELMGKENGILETAQLVLLFGTSVSLGALALRSSRDRIAASGGTAMCIIFFFRELEVHGVHAVFEFMSSDPMLYALGLVFAILLALVFYFEKAQVPGFLSWLARLEWWPFLVAGGLLIASYLAEQTGTELLEELLETNAYIILATVSGAAISALWKRPGNIRLDKGTI